jgi:branched-chain amino acid transport system permease protein
MVAMAAYVFNALYYAAWLFLLGAGLSIIYGLQRILNLAHGSLYAVGAFTAAWAVGLLIRLGFPPISWVILLIVTGAAGAAVVGILIEPTLLRPIYKRAEEFQLLLTFGILMIVEDVELMIWGPYPLDLKQPYQYAGSTDLLGTTIPVYNVIVVVFGFLVALGLWAFMYRTKLGIVIRAAASNREVTSAIGYNVGSLYTQTFLIGCILAGAAGGIVVPSASAQLGLGINVLVYAFVVVVIGGLGSMKGAFVGSLITGCVRAVGIVFFPELELAILWVVAIVVLIFRPLGLWGR